MQSLCGHVNTGLVVSSRLTTDETYAGDVHACDTSLLLTLERCMPPYAAKKSGCWQVVGGGEYSPASIGNTLHKQDMGAAV
jgi:hypothetical protein